MIYIFTHRSNAHTVRRLRRTAPDIADRLRSLSYQTLFGRDRCPPGTLVFTDFDLLNGFELDLAAALAEAAAAARPALPVLNHPGRALERFQLLRRLHRHGLNPVEVIRLDGEETPSRYPVFLRAEDGAFGPESGMIDNDAEFHAAVEALLRSGRTTKRRIAVSFEAAPDSAGFYRKYGALVIGDQIIPQHILRSHDWNVKSAVKVVDPDFAREEEAFVFDNPHREMLLPVARLAGIEFGRIDYTLRDGRPVVFEINTNPSFPRFTGGDPARERRRAMIHARILAALDAIDDAPVGAAPLRLPTPPLASENYINRSSWCEDPWAPFRRRRWLSLGRAAVRLGHEIEVGTRRLFRLRRARTDGLGADHES